MKTILVFSILCLIGQKVNAWGGLFNRFSPEMLANMGYGGHGGGGGFLVQRLACVCKRLIREGSIRGKPPGDQQILDMPQDMMTKKYNFMNELTTKTSSKSEWNGDTILKLNRNAIKWYPDGSKTTEGTGIGVFGPGIRNEGDENVLEEYVNENNDEDPCYRKPCTANEHCCPGQVCIDVDGVEGSCVYAFGRRVGELCRRDSDCESGLVCAEAEAGVSTRVCRPPVRQDKQYSEPCNMSSECDISRGLCCQLQRRHRQAPRRVCSYFKDPLVCIGPVASDQIKNNIQHTAGEKRLTGLGTFKRPMH